MTEFPTGRPEREAVSQILALLEAHLNALEEETPAIKRSERRYRISNFTSFAFLGGAFLLVIITNQLTVPYSGIAYPVLVFAAVLISLVANVRVIREQSHVFGALRKPRQDLLRRLGDVFELEEKTVENLIAYPLDSLVFTRARLLQAVDVRRERSEAVLGSASRLGLFPSVLTAFTAVLATLRNAPLWAQAAALVLTGLLILNQNTATTLQMALSDARVMSGLLDRAIQLQQGRGGGSASDASA